MTTRAKAAQALILALAFAAGCAATGGQSGGALRMEQVGVASYYASRFEGRATASGRTYHERKLTAAHRTLPIGTRVRVTNLENGRSVVVTITDRGPFHDDRIIDVSRRAARKLGFERAGTTRVRLTILSH